MRVLIFFALIACLNTAAQATPEYAERTGQPCAACHTQEGAAALNDTGKAFRNAGFRWPVDEFQEPPLPMNSWLRSLLGFLHLAAAFAWFGTIIYVHLILKPAYAAKGLPRAEVKLGVFGMFVVGITGVLLTLSRVAAWETMVDTRWGLLLTAKVAVYLVMISAAAYVVLYLAHHLKNPRQQAVMPEDGIFGPERLFAFDGRKGRPAFFAYRGKVLDATGLQKWKGGQHFRHMAGEDLTEELKNAPHGEEMLKDLKQVGDYNPGKGPELTPAQKSFYAIAYMNLALVFVVLGILALWRWHP